MAEALARHHAGGRIEVESAGTAPALSVAGNTLAVLAERGVDASHQRPKGLGEVDLPSCDRVITMGCCSADQLCPVTYAGAKEDWDVPDPVGLSVEEYRRVREIIEGKVRELLGRIGAAARAPEAKG